MIPDQMTHLQATIDQADAIDFIIKRLYSSQKSSD